jgi:ice-binding like protein
MPSLRIVHGHPARIIPFAAVALGISLFMAALPAPAAQTAVPLGTAQSFAVLAGSGITNTGATTITGDIGTFPTPTVTGFGSVTLIGTNHAGDGVTQGAKDDLVTAYTDASMRLPATSLPVELGGTTLPPGVYTSPTFGLTGVLTLDSGGDPDATFVFQAGSTLIAEVDSRVLLIGVDPCHVVWQVGSSATFKTGTDFVGDVLAYTSITAQTNATFQGRLLALNGAVTLDTNVITKADCVATIPVTTTTTIPVTTTTTTPSEAPIAAVPTGPVIAGPAVGPPAVPGGPLLTALGGPPTEVPDVPSTGTPSAPPSPGPGTPATPPSLPVTGMNTVGLMWTALALIAVGSGVILAGRRGHRKGFGLL